MIDHIVEVLSHEIQMRQLFTQAHVARKKGPGNIIAMSTVPAFPANAVSSRDLLSSPHLILDQRCINLHCLRLYWHHW